MITNAVEVAVKQPKQFIDLFAGFGGLSQSIDKAFKRNAVHVSASRDVDLWEANPALNDVEDAYLLNWEDEVPSHSLQPIRIELDTTSQWRLTKALLVRNIVRFFRRRGCPCQRDFIGRIEVFVPGTKTDASTIYQRYTVYPRYNDQIADGWQLDIAHGGVSLVSNRPTSCFELPDHGFDVIAGTEVLSYSKLQDYHWTRCRSTFYPIVNRTIARTVGLRPLSSSDSTKYKTKLDAASAFIAQWIYTRDFMEEVGLDFPNGPQFISIPESRVKMVPEAAKDLCYGDGTVSRLPKNDFKNHGPFHRPEQPFTYFFITHNTPACTSARNRLFNILQNGHDSDKAKPTEQDLTNVHRFPQTLSQLILQHVGWEGGLSFAYSDHQLAIPELEAHLQSSRFHNDKRYLALIVSDISKDNPDAMLHNLYFHMKELLMKYGITSQVIYCDNISKPNFNFFLPNIAAAIVGKEGGMAWGVKSLAATNDMVVGIGASYQRGLKQPYIGSAFCFNNEGGFRDFSFCRASDAEALQSSLKKAIWTFCDEYGKPDRLIIHYYKKRLRREESERIETMLRQCGIQCPIYVVNVVTAVNEDLIAFDNHIADLMPVSGTYVNLRHTEFLLYNNERYSPSDYKTKKLYPIKISISLGSANNTGGVLTYADADDIITQVYQFCRLYWKSVSMQNIPITTAYPELVASYVPHFRDEELPEFGRHNLWML